MWSNAALEKLGWTPALNLIYRWIDYSQAPQYAHPVLLGPTLSLLVWICFRVLYEFTLLLFKSQKNLCSTIVQISEKSL